MHSNITDSMIFDYIDSSFFLYKVCEGCESVILQEHIFCPKCDSYNFDSTYKRIKERFYTLIKNEANTN